MMNLALSNFQPLFTQYDTDGNGGLDKQELAKTSLYLLDEGKTEEGSLLSTLVVGGTDGNGFLPDDNQDGSVSFEEFSKLAASDGHYSTIGTEDFKTAFPGRSAEGGVTFDRAQLEAIAEPAPAANMDAPVDETPVADMDAPDDEAAPETQNQLQDTLTTLLPMLLQMLMTMMTSFFGGGNGGGISGGNPYGSNQANMFAGGEYNNFSRYGSI